MKKVLFDEVHAKFPTEAQLRKQYEEDRTRPGYEDNGFLVWLWCEPHTNHRWILIDDDQDSLLYILYRKDRRYKVRYKYNPLTKWHAILVRRADNKSIPFREWLSQTGEDGYRNGYEIEIPDNAYIKQL